VKRDLKDLKDGKDSKDDGRGQGELGEIRRWWGAWVVGASPGPVINPALLIRSFSTACWAWPPFPSVVNELREA